MAKGFDSPWIIVAIVAVILLTLSFAITQWLKYRYRLHDGKLGINQGLVFKRTHEIPLNRIQNVRLEQPLYFRPMGLYSLVVETAGSKQDEAVLAAVNYRQALQLKQRLFEQNSNLLAQLKTATLKAQPASTISKRLWCKKCKGFNLIWALSKQPNLVFGDFRLHIGAARLGVITV